MLTTTCVFAALVVTVLGAAIDRPIDRRAPPTALTEACTPDQADAISDSGFAGDGSAFNLSAPTGSLNVKTAFSLDHGIKTSPDEQGSFKFQVLSGTGTFVLSQEVCLITGRIYNNSYNIGMTRPPPEHANANSGCTTVFQLNDVSTAREIPVCEGSNDTGLGVCIVPSYDPSTMYVQMSMIFTVRTPVNKMGILFNCTGADYNTQVAVDQWVVTPSQKAASLNSVESA